MNATVKIGGFLLLALAWGATAHAAPRQIQLAPPASELGFRAYGLGFMPIDANFTRFAGMLSYDPANHASCHVELVADVMSVMTGDASTRATLVGSDFMDATRYPELAYAGNCDTQGISGMLRLHGITRPFTLSLDWTPSGVVAEGRLLRADWGMTAMPLLAGRTVRIRVAIPLPKTP